MLSRIFYAHGHFCAGHPVEVIVCTVTLVISFLSLAFLSHSDMVCGWNYDCKEEQSFTPSGSDVIIFSIIKCSAVIYTYLQFRNIRRRGTKYMLGLSGFLAVLPSFVFSIAIIKIFGNDLSGVKEVLPFFLLIIDLSKACALANFALSSSNQQEVLDNVAKGVSIIGPAMTLDTVAEVLVIGVGTLSDMVQLETTCYYGCLAVMGNYLAFIILYPACLALFIEVARNQGKEQALKQLARVAKLFNEEEREQHPNPVTQNIKIIMSAGLMIVHVHSRLIAEKKSGLGEMLTGHAIVNQQYREPDISLWHFYLQRFFTVRADSTFTLVLALFLVVKYMCYDEDTTALEIHQFLELEKESKIGAKSTRSVSFLDSAVSVDNPDSKCNTSSTPLKCYDWKKTSDTEENKSSSAAIFTLGEDSSDNETEVGGAVAVESVSTQTEAMTHYPPLQRLASSSPPRTKEECIQILSSEEGPDALTDDEVALLVQSKHIPQYKLETILGNHERGVAIRRKILSKSLAVPTSLECLPYEDNSSYELVSGACCENVVGYMPVPVGVAGPLVLDGRHYQVPLATTEGCLVASTNRGCRALQQSGGVHSIVIGDGMSRAPVVRLPSARQASKVKQWLEVIENFSKVKETFDDTSRFARLNKLHIAQAGRLLYIRFIARTGDAMGMNMLSKGAEAALSTVQSEFPEMDILSLSGNFCTDKKPAAINWIEGRGKSVVCEATIPASVVKSMLKTTVQSMVELNINKNLVGSAMAGSIGGYNAHAANIVTAMFIATGQDPAQAVTSCNCMTMMECTAENDLYISCTMPSLEVGTVGGGTILPPQAACLRMLGIQGSSEVEAGDNSKCLARIVCATVLAGELSLMGALAAGHLVRSHLKHNRSSVNMSSGSVSCQQSSSTSCASNNDVIQQSSKSSSVDITKNESCDSTVLKCKSEPSQISNIVLDKS